MSSNWTTTKQKFFSFPVRLPWNLLPFPSLTRLLLALTTSPSLISARSLGFILDSKLSMKKHIIKICQTAYFELKRISLIRRFLTEDATKTVVTSYTFHGLTTATVSLWVHLILSSNLSRKFRTLLQDLFSWHPVITTQHLSWKNCTGFPFQNVLSIKSLVCVSAL